VGGAPHVVTERRVWRTIWRVGRRLLPALIGLALIVLLVRGAGPRHVAEVLWEARAWLPIIVSLEVVQLLSDLATLSVLLGERRRDVPAGTWVRSSALAYALMILVPGGRAVGEVARVTVLAKPIGAPRAACASTQLQAAYAFAIALLSAIECAVVATSPAGRSPLPILLAGNSLLMATLSAGLLAILWDARAGRWLDRMRRRFLPASKDSAPLDEATRRRWPWRAALLCTLSRTAQLVQYGVILRAVGGATGVRRAMIAHGVHLVGATFGDVVPNGLGIVDAAYRTFAAEVGFGDAPARALSIAFVAHLGQLMVATASVLTLLLSRFIGSRRSASSSASGASSPDVDTADTRTRPDAERVDSRSVPPRFSPRP
jgi:hypothetical protein